MKKSFIILLVALTGCNTGKNTDQQKQAIINFLQEDAKEVKTDLQIEILNLEISDITVADSIAILKNRYEKEKASKIKKAEDALKRSQKTLDKQLKILESKTEKRDRIVDEIFEKKERKSVEANKNQLEEIRNWNPAYLNRYEGRDNSELLVKKATTTFSYFNPSLQTRQERTDTFVFSKDGKKVLGMMSRGKLRRKK